MRVWIGLTALAILSATPAAALDINTPYLKVDEGFYIGAYCHISEGKTQAMLKTALGLASIAGLPGELANMGFQTVTMNKGDVVCFWLHVNHEKRDRLKRENRMSRRHVINTGDKELVRKTSSYTVKIYGSDKKQIGGKSDTCSDHRHCSTNVVKPTSPASGIAMCIEPALANNQKVSIVFAQGSTPVETTNGKLANTGCDARKAEFDKTS